MRNGITVEEFKQHILPQVPEQFIEMARTGKLTAADLAEFSRYLGKYEITERLGKLEVQSYLREVLAAINALIIASVSRPRALRSNERSRDQILDVIALGMA